MKLLELFCGSKSVSRAIGNQYDEIISLDIDYKCNPTICIDILKWDYTIYPKEYFNCIWASPPCTEYSCLNYAMPNKIRNLDHSDLIVKRTLEIIDYFNPDKFFIENPQSGILKDREFMEGIPYIDFDYCRFSDWGYRKRTRIWTSSFNIQSLLCLGPSLCKNMIGKKHKSAIGNHHHAREFWAESGKRLDQRHSIPEKLIKYLFSI